MATRKSANTEDPNVLQDELKKLKEEVARLKAEKKEIEEEAKRAPGYSGGHGWLIVTRDPQYDGVTYGINFKRGIAFIPYNSKPVAGIAYKEKGMIDESVNPAERLAKLLESDFGYEVIYIDGSDKSKEMMREILDRRDDEYRQAALNIASENVKSVLI